MYFTRNIINGMLCYDISHHILYLRVHFVYSSLSLPVVEWRFGLPRSSYRVIPPKLDALITSVLVSYGRSFNTTLFWLIIWSPCVADADIKYCSCGFFFYLLLFFLAYSQRSEIGCLPPYMWCGLSANLECMSEMCCTRLAEKYMMQKLRKNRHLGTIVQLCRAMSSQLTHVSTIGKNLLNINISSTCLHNMVNVGPLTAEFGLPVWGTPANFNGFRVLASLLLRRRSTDVNQTLHDHGWPSPGLIHYIYTFGGSCLLKAKFHYASWFEAGSSWNLAYRLA